MRRNQLSTSWPGLTRPSTSVFSEAAEVKTIGSSWHSLQREVQSMIGSQRVVWIALASIVLLRLLPLGAYPVLDPTEARYAVVAKLMVESGNWITPFLEPDVPFLGKPPLSFWAGASSYVIFGINAFAARLPSFVAWLITAGLVFSLALRATNTNPRNLALVATCVFASSALAFYLTGAVMTDSILLLGITLAMAAFWMRLRGASIVWGYLFFIGLAVAVLAKGLIGVPCPVDCSVDHIAP
jgi:4-amino-4-deoxy-L-arabinose transferase-like glycosyltransferase